MNPEALFGDGAGSLFSPPITWPPSWLVSYPNRGDRLEPLRRALFVGDWANIPDIAAGSRGLDERFGPFDESLLHLSAKAHCVGERFALYGFNRLLGLGADPANPDAFGRGAAELVRTIRASALSADCPWTGFRAQALDVAGRALLLIEILNARGHPTG